jgi:hypothetical protein
MNDEDFMTVLRRLAHEYSLIPPPFDRQQTSLYLARKDIAIFEATEQGHRVLKTRRFLGCPVVIVDAAESHFVIVNNEDKTQAAREALLRFLRDEEGEIEVSVDGETWVGIGELLVREKEGF